MAPFRVLSYFARHRTAANLLLVLLVLQYRLWFADGLRPGARLRATWASELPPSAEGFVLDGSHALVVTDGAEGDGACGIPSRQHRVSLASKPDPGPIE